MRRAGFTLTELLVVIAVMGLLIAILVPCLQKSRQHAKAVQCASNVKQLLLGLAMYETENDTLPHGFDDTRLDVPPGGYPGDPAFDRLGWWWFNHIVGYSEQNSCTGSVMWCPSREVEGYRLKRNSLCANYGVNQSVCRNPRGREDHAEFIGKPLSTADISRPGETLLVVDSGYSTITWWHATDAPPNSLGGTIEDAAYVPGLRINKQRQIWPGQEYDATNGRHPDRTVNVGFAGGHVTRKKADDLSVEKTGDTYRNRSPLWLPK
jgi:prepilin-type N-terminal cleavage/methylation domain-containing protein/prepilin-type processing-associated H-X9-DG protein